MMMEESRRSSNVNVFCWAEISLLVVSLPMAERALSSGRAYYNGVLCVLVHAVASGFKPQGKRVVATTNTVAREARGARDIGAALSNIPDSGTIRKAANDPIRT